MCINIARVLLIFVPFKSALKALSNGTKIIKTPSDIKFFTRVIVTLKYTSKKYFTSVTTMYRALQRCKVKIMRNYDPDLIVIIHVSRFGYHIK